MEELDKLLDTAIQKANSSGTLDDLNKAAAIAKAAAEAHKAKSDVANSKTQIWLEYLKSVATFLIPVVSFLTIGFTVYMQYLQLQETQRQNEATQWREFLSSAKTTANAVQSDPTFAPRLRSFFASPNYKDQAISISKRMMGGIASAARFSDLFNVTFTAVDATTLPDLVEVGQLLNSNATALYSECAAFKDDLDDNAKTKIPETRATAGICASDFSEKSIKELGLNLEKSQRLHQLRRDVDAFESEMFFLSVRIAELLRSNYAVGSPPSNTTIRLNKLLIFGADLSNVDFSSFDISDTAFDQVVLKGAKLTPKLYGSSLEFRESEWWEVQAIDQTGIKTLITDRYPYYAKDALYPGDPDITADHYAERIKALCVPFQPFCAPDKLQFEKKQSTKSP